MGSVLKRAVLAGTLVGLALPLPAVADEGVSEINQTCAVQTGCFAGDAPGFPVTISTPGTSYRLTSALTLPNANTNGVVVTAADVSIDLNGFGILGPVTCTFTTPLPSCTPSSGTGSGVASTTPGVRGVSVKNGSISGMGSHGVVLGEQSEVAHLRVRYNMGNGILTGSGSRISDNAAFSNGLDGISSSVGSTISRNATYLNFDDGISVGGGATISGNTAYLNLDDGIVAGTGTSVLHNTVHGNQGDGVVATVGSTIQRTTSRRNVGVGLSLVQATYRENTITNNSGGTVTGSGAVNLGDNACNGTSTCP